MRPLRHDLVVNQSAHAGQIGGTVSHLDAPLNNARVLAIDSRLDGYEVYSDSDRNFQFSVCPMAPTALWPFLLKTVQQSLRYIPMPKTFVMEKSDTQRTIQTQ